jgi:dTDP-4-dehydrorhamnose 3,5-epimerase-like enzyme
MNHEVVTPSFIRKDERGLFIEALNGGRWESLVCGQMHPGSVMGHHYHRKTQIFFFLITGSVRIDFIHVETKERSTIRLKGAEGILLQTHESHAIHFLDESEFVMMKSLRYDPADSDTIPYPVPPLE